MPLFQGVRAVSSTASYFSAIGYAQLALNGQLSPSHQVPVDPTQFGTGQQGWGTTKADPTTKTITCWVPQIQGSYQQLATYQGAGCPGLTQYAIARMTAAVNAHIAQMKSVGHPDYISLEYVKPDDWTSWLLIAVGLGLIATAIAMGWMFAGAGLILDILILVLLTAAVGFFYAGITAYLSSPTQTGTVAGPNGEQCPIYQTQAGACYVVCSDSNGNPTVTDCTGNPPGGLGSIGAGLEQVAVGVGLIALVAVGAYVGYKVISGHNFDADKEMGVGKNHLIRRHVSDNPRRVIVLRRGDYEVLR